MNAVRIRPFEAGDREPIRQILVETEFFVQAEVDVAIELIDVYLTRPEQKDYVLHTAVDEKGTPAGYVCFGPTPCTDGTWDLYWIAVDRRLQNRRIGRQLLRFSEEEIRARRARMVLVETSSQPRYEGTRAFYTKNEYVELARVRDFYRVGDDKVILGKRFS
ncbi:MAG: GNAT family N-acetyltransferase [Planctomycetes bacterium]|nr:GNAT family N-acetyltransferase [Planctomycetota bacterium]